jgi:hypothetical protein
MGPAEGVCVAARMRFLRVLPFEGVAELYARKPRSCVSRASGASALGDRRRRRPWRRKWWGRPPDPFASCSRRGFVAEAVSAKALARTVEGALGDRVGRRPASERGREFARAELTVEALRSRYDRVYQEAAA